MIDLSTRSDKKELLDGNHIPFEDIRRNMQELNKINTLLGGHKITIDAVQQLLNQATEKETLIICEIGCGGGDNLRAIEKFLTAKKITAKFIGIDIKKECIDFAKQQYPHMNAEWICSDYRKVNFTGRKPSIIFSSLFCHHFANNELQPQLQWMQENATKGFFINDLHRNLLAYYSIKWITAIFSGSYLVKNDAPLSVARGFVKKEWEQIFSAAGIVNFSIEWKWAFRYLIIYKHA